MENVVTVDFEIDEGGRGLAKIEEIERRVDAAFASPARTTAAMPGEQLARSLEKASVHAATLNNQLAKPVNASGVASVGQTATQATTSVTTLSRQINFLHNTAANTAGFDKLQKEINESSARFNNLQKELSESSSRFNNLQKELDETASRADRATRRIDALHARLAKARTLRGRGRGAAGSIADDVLGAAGLSVPVGAGATAAVGGALAAGVLATKAAYDAGRELERSNRLIAASAKESGLAYDLLTKKAEAFARLTNQTKAAGQETFAKLTQLAQVAGRTDQIDEIGKRFADLGAARGLKGEELQTIARQILSGEDEGINRLGLPNPGKLYEEYAKSIGVASDKLTQQQQVVAVLDAVMRKSLIFDGSAEKQLQSATGQVDAFFNNLKNKSAAFGQGLIDGIAPAFQLLNTVKPVDSVSFSKSLTAALRGDLEAAAQSFYKSLEQSDIASLGIGAAVRVTRENADKAEYEHWQKIHQGRVTAYKAVQDQIDAHAKESATNREFIEAQHTGKMQEWYQKQLKAQNPNALGFDQVKDFAKLTPSSLASNADFNKLSDDQRKKVEEYIKASEASRNFEQQEERKEQERKEQERKEQERKAEATERETQTRLKAALRDTQAEARRIAGLLDNDNPFVGYFFQADEAARRFQARLLEVGADTTRELLNTERTAIAANALSARFDSQLKALQMRQEAQRLSQQSSFDLTGTEERRLSVIRAQVEAYREIPDLVARAVAIQQGAVGKDGLIVNGERVNFQQFTGLQNLARTNEFASGAFGREAREVIDAQLRQLFSQLSPSEQRGAVANPNSQAAFAGAFTRGAEFRQVNFQREIERAQEGARAARNANEAIDLVRRTQLAGSGLGQAAIAEADKRILAITSALDPRELTGNVRRGRIESLEREAKREAEKEKQAGETNAKLNNFLDAVLLQLQGKGLKLDASETLTTVRVTNDTSATVTTKQLGAAY